MDRLASRDGLMLLGMNLVPLVGALVASWDGVAIMLYYWMETAIIGVWLVLRVANTPVDGIGAKLMGSGQAMSPIGLALFIVAHAGIFMGVHLFFLFGLLESALPPDLRSPATLFPYLLFERGFWIPLTALAVIRGLFTVADWRAGRSVGPAIVDFYIRIFVMQFAVLLTGWVFLLLLPFGVDAAIGGVAALVLVKTASDFLWGRMRTYVIDSIENAAGAADR